MGWYRVACGLAVVALLSCDPARAASVCSDIKPDMDTEQNYRNIVTCLVAEGAAHLSSGRFAVSQKIKMPPRSQLSGSPGTVIEAVDSGTKFKDNSIIELTGQDVVKDMAFVGDGRLVPGCCTTVVAVTGSGSKILNADISDEDASRRRTSSALIRVAGVYFIGASDSRDNLGSGLKIHGLNFGVIFRKGLSARANNRIADSEIFDLSCDAFSFAGGGMAEGNRLHDSGFDCKQRPVPIPGGGFYAINNSEPVVIANNTITDICGVGFDIVGAANFRITGNTYHQRNAPLQGRYPYCNGFPAKLVDVSGFTVSDNTFSVADAPPLGRAYQYFPAFKHANAATYNLTPDSEREIYAVRLLRQSRSVGGNKFANNKMIAECSRGGPCAGGGIGLFVGPGVGGAAPNSFVRNTIIGSRLPAVRCGHDRYEQNLLCRVSTPEGTCASAAELEKAAETPLANEACSLLSP